MSIKRESVSRVQVDELPCDHFAVRPVIDKSGVDCTGVRLEFASERVSFLVPSEYTDKLIDGLVRCRDFDPAPVPVLATEPEPAKIEDKREPEPSPEDVLRQRAQARLPAVVNKS